jgi:hypothetical protein
LVNRLPRDALYKNIVPVAKKEKGIFFRSEEMSKDAPKEQVKAVKERITKLTAGFNVRVKELRERARH